MSQIHMIVGLDLPDTYDSWTGFNPFATVNKGFPWVKVPSQKTASSGARYDTFGSPDCMF